MSGFINEDGFPVKPILIGTAAAVAVAVVILCAICGILTVIQTVSPSLLPYLALIADAGGIFCGGYIAAALNKSRGLILGLVCGFLMFVILFFAGLCAGGTVGVLTVLRLVILLVFGIGGGILGVNKKERLRIK